MYKALIKFIFISAFIFCDFLCRAQNYSCNIEGNTGKNDFYKIRLSPSIIAHLNDKGSNIRIYKKGNDKEIPYLLDFNKAADAVAPEFRRYDIVENKTEKNKTTIIFENSDGTMVDHILLSIKNAEVIKHCVLSGSNNQQEWFMVKQSFFISPSQNNDTTISNEYIPFPLSDYKFYKIEIDNKHSGLIKILGAGYYQSYPYKQVQKNAVSIIDGLKFSQVDSSNKNTYVKIYFDHAGYKANNPDFLKIEIAPDSSRSFFYRNCSLALKRTVTIKHRPPSTSMESIRYFSLSSETFDSLGVYLPRLGGFYIIIENKDNVPLKIQSVKAYQFNHYLTAYLNADKNYQIKIDSDNLPLPEYDINYFKNKIPASPPVLEAGALMAINTNKAGKNIFNNEFLNKKTVWIVIIVVLLLLAYVSQKIVKEMKNKKEDSRLNR